MYIYIYIYTSVIPCISMHCVRLPECADAECIEAKHCCPEECFCMCFEMRSRSFVLTLYFNITFKEVQNLVVQFLVDSFPVDGYVQNN